MSSVRSSKYQLLSCVRLFVTPWTLTCQAPLSMEFSRQEYWSGLPFPSPGDLPDPGILCHLSHRESVCVLVGRGRGGRGQVAVHVGCGWIEGEWLRYNRASPNLAVSYRWGLSNLALSQVEKEGQISELISWDEEQLKEKTMKDITGNKVVYFSFYWDIIAWQCFVSFCCTIERISYV